MNFPKLIEELSGRDVTIMRDELLKKLALSNDSKSIELYTYRIRIIDQRIANIHEKMLNGIRPPSI